MTGKKKLIKEYENKGIITCELKFENCWYDNTLAFAHRHKRRFYYSKPELLWTFNQTVLACNSCHGQIEYDSDLTEEIFNRLRGKELL